MHSDLCGRLKYIHLRYIKLYVGDIATLNVPVELQIGFTSYGSDGCNVNYQTSIC